MRESLTIFAFLTVLLMVLTATAVPTKNAEPVMGVVEKQEEMEELVESITVILESGDSVQEKQSKLESLLDGDTTLLIIIGAFLTILIYTFLLLNPVLWIVISLFVFLVVFLFIFFIFYGGEVTFIEALLTALFFGVGAGLFWPYVFVVYLFEMYFSLLLPC